jgi:2-polyprenyl-6-methoxyphenol hydroxylase-like FAD-dependent oxidoreductase
MNETARPVKSERLPVVIVGAGPAGLTAAIALARYGVECLVVESRLQPSTLPKATVISVRNMEMLRSWGLEDEVLAGGNDVDWRMMVCRTLAEASSGQTIQVGYPTKDESMLVSPAAPACVPQDHLESVMRDHLRTFPGVDLRTGVDVVDVTQYDGTCLVVLEDRATHTTSTVAASYVIGADGAHGVVRKRAGIGIRTYPDTPQAFTAVVHAPLFDVVGQHRYGIYSVEHPDAPTTLLPAGRDDRWIQAFQWDPTTERIEDYTPDRLTALLRIATGRADLPVRVGPIGSFSFAGAMADSFRNERIFLVGDAAHRVTPRGGTGMNTAIGDGFDLGWKLAWVLQGWSCPSLLDSYETERRPVAAHNLERSLDVAGSRRTVQDELNVDIGGRIRHLWLPEAATDTRTSTLDLVGPGLTLFTDASGTSPGRASAMYYAAPVTTRSVDTVVARGLGIMPGGGMLVRPDGVPVRAWNHARTSDSNRVLTAA